MDSQSGEGALSEVYLKAQEFKNSGNEKFNNLNYKGAVVDYKKGLLHDPNNSDLHSNISAAYIHLEKYIEAEEHAVYTIHLKPNFYKGYVRAAKAAHGKGMTKLALNRLTAGMAVVTDPNGIKELSRLKNQYTAYLSLASNKEREMTFDDSYMYQSDDDDQDQDSDNEDYSEDLAQPLDPSSEDQPLVMQTPREMTDQSAMSQVIVHSKAKKESPRVVPPAKEDQKGKVDPKSSQSNTTLQSKTVDKDGSFNRKEEKKTDKFLEMCRDLTKDQDLTKHVAEFKGSLKTASEAFLSGNYRKAVENYKAAKERVGIQFTDYEIDDRQFHVIKYALCAALINLDTYDEITKAIQTLVDMETYKFSIPALYIQMARAYYKLNRFKTALEPLEKLQDILDNFPIFPTFSWPGTTETIQETTPTGLKSAMKELNQMCRMSHKPTAVCRFDNCLKISTHILPSELIYDSDPDFAGFVRMICEEKCHIEFHISCWKSYKESICGIGKINDKDFCGRHCLTTDCVSSDGVPSFITSIEIIGSDGQVKSTMKLDHKAIVDSKKSKKKSRLDDKEKSIKPKKIKEKKVREFKKPVVVPEEEEEPVEPVRVYVDPVPKVRTSQISHFSKPVIPSHVTSRVFIPDLVHKREMSEEKWNANLYFQLEQLRKALQSRLQSLVDLRKINFGLDDNYWNPKNSFFGRTEETMKAVKSQFLEEQDEKVDVRDAKEFLFSYFMSILKDEGPLKQSEVEALWKESAGDFCDITVVLPNLKSMCELLTESTRFCQLEDYICLADQLEEAYDIVKMEVSETVNFLMTGSASIGDSSQQTTGTAGSSHLPDLVNHPNSANNQSSSEDESYDGNSGDESGDSEEEVSEEEENVQQPPPPETPCESQTEEPAVEPPKPVDDGKFSIQEMLNEMSRVKSIFLKAAEDTETNEKLEELDGSQDKVLDSTSNDTFETAHSGSLNATDDTKNGTVADRVLSESSIDEPEAEVFYSDEQTSDTGDTETTIIPDKPEEVGDDVDSEETVKGNEEEELTVEHEEQPKTDQQISVDNVEEDISPHSEVTTIEKDIQTLPLETKDTDSQTKESAVYIELNAKVEELSNQLQTLNLDNCRLSNEIAEKEALNEQMKSAHEEVIARLQEENRKNIKQQEFQHEILKADFSKREETFKQNESELTSKVSFLQGLSSGLVLSNDQLKRELSTLEQDCTEVKGSLTLAVANIKEIQANYLALEETLKTKLQKSQQTQLNSIKVYWESQIKLLRKRCVEKISDMQNWLSMFPSQEVEDLPSMEAIRQNTMRWGDIYSKIQQIENSFQEKCSILEVKIARSEEVEELSTMVLPPLPEEPTPVPLDKIYKEFTEKHLKVTKENHAKKVEELTQLVVSQQLEIEKMKEANQQFQQLMNSFQMAPRMQTPMTTAFGGLALQYSYPPSLSTQFGQTPVPTLPPPTQDTVKVGSPVKLLQTGVQTLLQESSKTTNFTNSASGKQAFKDESAGSRGQTPSLPKAYPYLTTPQPTMDTSAFAAGAPSLMGVAHNLLKSNSSSSIEKRDTKPGERSSTPKPEVAKSVKSRETTPVRGSTPAPTPEKPRKKKKTRSESRDTVEPKVETPVNVEPRVRTPVGEEARVGTPLGEEARVGTPFGEETVTQKQDKNKDDDEGSWNLVTAKPLMLKLNSQPSVQMSETKPKGKQKLLANLQKKFPTTSERDLDEIVKHVREQNGGSLSGLLFEDIETRTERIIAKRNFMKTSTMGLVKFSDAAWGSVKQQETITWDNLQLDECTICLEPMGQDRTKVNCNHEFHTKCLRKWLKEKSVCPLCNKFTTMPDEFPAL